MNCHIIVKQNSKWEDEESNRAEILSAYANLEDAKAELKRQFEYEMEYFSSQELLVSINENAEEFFEIERYDGYGTVEVSIVSRKLS